MVLGYVIQLAGANCDEQSSGRSLDSAIFFLRVDEQNEQLVGGGSHQLDKLSYMGVSLNGGTPKWMVYNGKPF